MKFQELFLNIAGKNDSPHESEGDNFELEVHGICSDARKAELGFAFIAIPGEKVDGHQFIPEAIAKGATVLVVQDKTKVPGTFTGKIVEVENSRQTLDVLAARFYRDPSKEMFCFGVTGTNGKTSITYMIESILGRYKIPVGVLGTVNHHLGEQVWPSDMTTPDPISLQQRLREMREAGAKAIAMEVSSHALAQSRADAVQWNAAIFTNLTRDHLDYHADMNDYFQSKQKLFTDLLWQTPKDPTFAVVNIDDDWGARMKVAAPAILWTYGQRADADFCFRILKSDFQRTDYEVRTPFGSARGWLPMCGEHNIYNAMAAVAAAVSAGIPVSYALEALTHFTGVPGRLQSVPNQKYLNVFVDYAHTPDALENVLRSLNHVKTEASSSAKIWTIFGCGGDRDKGKRPLMAQIAAKYSDRVYVTSDNPRTEDPTRIISDILAGFSEDDKQAKVFVEADRKKAIQTVINKASGNDVILIAGKGHEDYQIIGTQKNQFSDYEVAKEVLA